MNTNLNQLHIKIFKFKLELLECYITHFWYNWKIDWQIIKCFLIISINVSHQKKFILSNLKKNILTNKLQYLT